MSQSPVKTHAPLVTGFGSAALSRALVEQLRTKGARQAIILTPLTARVPDLTALLEAEGLGQARILTFTRYALELAGHPGAVAVTRPQKWFLFRKAFCDSPSGVREAFARESQAMEALFHLLDSLRANRVRGSDLEGLQNSHPGAGALAALLHSYESNLRDRNILDDAGLVQAAIERVGQDSLELPALHAFDLLHEARPDELELSIAIAGTGAACVFFCDTDAPPPAGRAVVRGVASELARRIPGLERRAAVPSPNEDTGRRIAAGQLDSLDEGVQLMQFNDEVSELRGLAQTARALQLEEGLQAQEMAFFLTGGRTQAALLQYELEHAQVLLKMEPPALRGGVGLKREVRLVLGLLMEPERAGLLQKALSLRMEPDESQLTQKLARLTCRLESAGIEEIMADALALLLPDVNEREKRALEIYRKAAADFAALSGTGGAARDLPPFAAALNGYLEEFARENRYEPEILLSPRKPAARHPVVVFLPSIVAGREHAIAALPGVDEIAGALERRLGRPVYLPAARKPEERARYDCGSAAAAGTKVVLSFHRLRQGRSVEPLAWLGRVIDGARSIPVEAFREEPVTRPPAASARVEVPPGLSASAIRDYVTCPHMFYLRHILGLQGPEGARMLLGSLLHRVLAKFHAPGESDFSAERMRQLVDDDPQAAQLGGETLAEARALLGAYVSEKTTCREETLSVEKRFRLSLGGAEIYGRIDRIVASGSGVKIIDYKTSGSGKEVKHRNAVVKRLEDIQLPLYALAAREEGRNVEAFSYIYLNYEKTNRPHEMLLSFAEEGGRGTISEAELLESAARVESVVAEILAGREEYERGENAPCRRRAGACGFWAMCSAAGR